MDAIKKIEPIQIESDLTPSENLSALNLVTVLSNYQFDNATNVIVRPKNVPSLNLNPMLNKKALDAGIRRNLQKGPQVSTHSEDSELFVKKPQKTSEIQKSNPTVGKNSGIEEKKNPQVEKSNYNSSKSNIKSQKNFSLFERSDDNKSSSNQGRRKNVTFGENNAVLNGLNVITELKPPRTKAVHVVEAPVQATTESQDSEIFVKKPKKAQPNRFETKQLVSHKEEAVDECSEDSELFMRKPPNKANLPAGATEKDNDVEAVSEESELFMRKPPKKANSPGKVLKKDQRGKKEKVVRNKKLSSQGTDSDY